MTHRIPDIYLKSVCFFEGYQPEHYIKNFETLAVKLLLWNM